MGGGAYSPRSSTAMVSFLLTIQTLCTHCFPRCIKMYDKMLQPEPMHLPMVVHDVGSYNLNITQMFLNNVTNKHAEEDTCHLKDGETPFDQGVDGQHRVHNMSNW
jgi:hypothetical protein